MHPAELYMLFGVLFFDMLIQVYEGKQKSGTRVFVMLLQLWMLSVIWRMIP